MVGVKSKKSGLSVEYFYTFVLLNWTGEFNYVLGASYTHSIRMLKSRLKLYRVMNNNHRWIFIRYSEGTSNYDDDASRLKRPKCNRARFSGLCRRQNRLMIPGDSSPKLIIKSERKNFKNFSFFSFFQTFKQRDTEKYPFYPGSVGSN